VPYTHFDTYTMTHTETHTDLIQKLEKNIALAVFGKQALVRRCLVADTIAYYLYFPFPSLARKHDLYPTPILKPTP